MPCSRTPARTRCFAVLPTTSFDDDRMNALAGAGGPTRRDLQVQRPQSQPACVFALFLPLRFPMSRAAIRSPQNISITSRRRGLLLDSFRVGFRYQLPRPDLETFHSQDTLIQQPVADRKAAPRPLGYLSSTTTLYENRDGASNDARKFDDRNSDNAVGLEHLPLRQADFLNNPAVHASKYAK